MQKYLTFISKLESVNKQFKLNKFEVELLQALVIMQLDDELIFVKTLIRRKDIASQATLHRELKALVRRGLLSTRPLESDGRHKIVGLGRKGQAYFGTLNRAFLSSRKLK